MKLLTDQQGIVLVISLLILALLMGAGVGAMVSVQTDLRISSNLQTATKAFYIAEAGIERAKAEISDKGSIDLVLVGFDGEKIATGDNGVLSFGASVSFAGGTYEVRVTDNMDDTDIWDDSDRKVYITSTGKFGGSTRVIRALVTKASLRFNAPVTIVDDKCRFHFSGSALIDGHDKSYDPQDQNKVDPGPGPDVHGLARTCTISNQDVFTPADKVNDIRGLDGDGDLTSDVGSLKLSELQAVRSELISIADTTYHGDTDLSGKVTLGTRESPKITYVNGFLTISEGATGVGILVVDNDFKVTGNFTYEGIILVGICTACPGRVDIPSTGNVKIYGAIVLANPTSSHDEEARIENMAGNSTIYYSTYGIHLALGRTFKTLVWQEIFG